MERVEGKDVYVLDSGRKIFTNRGIIGLGPELDRVYHGFDGVITRTDVDSDTGKAFQIDPFTEAERRELADFMITLWERYAREGVQPR